MDAGAAEVRLRREAGFGGAATAVGGCVVEARAVMDAGRGGGCGGGGHYGSAATWRPPQEGRGDNGAAQDEENGGQHR